MFLKSVRVNSDRFPGHRHYPFNIPAFQDPVALEFKKTVTLFVGENGSGKSTLLDAIARKCGVHIWDRPRRHLAHNNPFETKLVNYVSADWSNGHVPGSIFRAETFRDLADFLDDVALCDPGRLDYHGGHILNTLSHGEGILSYLSGRFHVKGIYFLDEPEAALSPSSQVKLVRLLQHLELGSQAQFIIATHSPLLLAYPGAHILSFGPREISEIAYEDTTHYQIYADFFANPTAFFSDRGEGRWIPDTTKM
jgi:predicted ATPase